MKRGEKEKEMYQKIEAWKQSGMSMTSYANSQGFTASGFEYWVRKYRKHIKKNIEFVQVFPSAKAEPQPMQAQHLSVEPSQGEIFFSFANGMTIRINL